MSGMIRLRPSDAETWLNCTASPVLIADNPHLVPENTDNAFSVEGTQAHEFAAQMLSTGKADIPDTAMHQHVTDYCEFVTSKMKPGDELLVEQQLPLWYMPHRVGNVDAVVIGDGRIYITDFKYGAGIAVFARNNPQLAIYGRSTVEVLKELGYDINDQTLVTLAIFQPRCSRGEKFTLWALRVHELVDYTDRIAAVADDILARRNLKYEVSKSNCRWCKAAGFCAERTKVIAGEEGFNILPATPPRQVSGTAMPQPAVMSPEMIAAVLDREDDIKAWLKSVRDYATNLLQSGDPNAIPGWKLVESTKQGNREWVDEKAADTLLANKLPANVRWSKQLISPAQAEKLIPKSERNAIFDARWDKLIHRAAPKGKTLVPAMDPREPATIQAELEFDVIETVEDIDTSLL